MTTAAAAAAALREPWESLDRQREAASFGMWLFLASEALFFGGLFLAYAYCRHLHPEAFAAAGRETEITLGFANSAILLTSGLTMATAAAASRAGLRWPTFWLLLATAALGLAFVAVKGFEYAEDLDKGLLPRPGHPEADAAGTALFWSFYWLMTGLHGIHVLAGVGLILRLAVQGGLLPRSLPLQASPAVEATSLYWGLVDMMWIFLFPLLYLPGRAG